GSAPPPNARSERPTTSATGVLTGAAARSSWNDWPICTLPPTVRAGTALRHSARSDGWVISVERVQAPVEPLGRNHAPAGSPLSRCDSSVVGAPWSTASQNGPGGMLTGAAKVARQKPAVAEIVAVVVASGVASGTPPAPPKIDAATVTGAPVLLAENTSKPDTDSAVGAASS